MADALSEQVNIRLSKDDLAKVDAYIAKMGERTPGVKFTRTDAIRSLIVQGLAASEFKARLKRQR